MTLDLIDRPLDQLEWLSDADRALLRRLGLSTWRQLLEHYPRRYEDRALFAAFPTESAPNAVCLRGTIQKVSAHYFGGRKVVEATLDECWLQARS
jgi:RecG-like helicase